MSFGGKLFLMAWSGVSGGAAEAVSGRGVLVCSFSLVLPAVFLVLCVCAFVSQLVPRLGASLFLYRRPERPRLINIFRAPTCAQT